MNDNMSSVFSNIVSLTEQTQSAYWLVTRLWEDRDSTDSNQTNYLWMAYFIQDVKPCAKDEENT